MVMSDKERYKDVCRKIEEKSLTHFSAYLYQRLLEQVNISALSKNLFADIVYRLMQSIDNGSLAIKIKNAEMELLHTCSLVASIETDTDKSLVLDGSYLYLRRYWLLEESIVCLLKDRIFTRLQSARWGSVPVDTLKTIMEEWRQVESITGLELFNAGKIIASSDFLLLSGGPGSGKTYSLVKILKLLSRLVPYESKNVSVLLTAPTAKAVTRMYESIGQWIENSLFDVTVHTLHRALGYRRDGTFSHGKDHAWRYDLVIIDEISMVDAYLFRHILLSLSSFSKLIILGDANQLPSIDSGAILSDLVYWCKHEQYIPKGKDFALKEHIIFLQGSKRSSQDILELANDFLQGNIASVNKKREQFFHNKNTKSSIQFYLLGKQIQVFYDWIIRTYGFKNHKYLIPLDQYDAELGLSHEHMDVINNLFNLYEDFIVISPIHNGSYGVQTINDHIKSILGQGDLLYHGMPIVLTANQPTLELSNGDRGIIIDFSGVYYAVFRRASGGFDSYLPSDLYGYDVAYAITVHKSQGSEYRRVAVVLPDAAKRLLSCQLIYTAITRAKEEVMIFSEDVELDQSLVTKNHRVSQIPLKILL